MQHRQTDSRPVSIVDSAATTAQMIDTLRAAPMTAADMEFSADTTRVLLMQFATATDVYLFDPVTADDIAPVLQWLADPDATKVFHSGHDDTRLVAQQYDVDTRGVQDTQIYAGFCGYRYPVSLASLVESNVGVELSKEQQRSDWGARPLSSDQIAYAAADVLYLDEILDRLSEQIGDERKIEWAREESRRVVEERTGHSVPEARDWRFVDEWRESPEETLLAWRVLDWSRGLSLPRIRGKKRKVRPRDIERIMARIRRGSELSPGARDLPDWLTQAHAEEIAAMRERDATEQERARVEELPPQGPSRNERGQRVAQIMAHIEARCEEMKIAPSLVATKGTVEDYVRFGEAAQSVLTRGWRAELLGPL